MIIAPMAMTTTFAAFTGDTALIYFPGAPFVLSMVLVIVAIVLFVRYRPLNDATETS